MVALRWRTELHSKLDKHNRICVVFYYRSTPFDLPTVFIWCTVYYSSIAQLLFNIIQHGVVGSLQSQESNSFPSGLILFLITSSHMHINTFGPRAQCTVNVFAFAYITYCCATNAQHQQETSKWRVSKMRLCLPAIARQSLTAAATARLCVVCRLASLP